MKFIPIIEYYTRFAGHNRPPVVRCPEYWECGDYADWARDGHKPGKVAVRCAYHARRIEDEEARDSAQA